MTYDTNQAADLTRPITDIKLYSAQEVFDTMCARILRAYADAAGPIARQSSDRLGAVKVALAAFDKAILAFDPAISPEDRRVNAMSAALSALEPAGDAEVARIGDAVLDWMVKCDLLDGGNEYHTADVIAVLNDLMPAERAPDVPDAVGALASPSPSPAPSVVEEATHHAVELAQCSIFAADVGDSIAKAMTDAAAFLRQIASGEVAS